MCQVNPEYKQHVTYENEKKVLYRLVFREIYGCIEYALLWYLLLIIIDRSPGTNSVRIVGRFCSTPFTEAKETLDSVPI